MPVSIKVYHGYKVGDTGVIISKRGFILSKFTKKTSDYLYVSIMVDGKVKQKSVHSVVWEVFKGKVPRGFTIDHINGDRFDNRLSNLRLLPRGDNAREGCSLLTRDEVLSIRLARECGVSPSDIANCLSISKQSVCDITKRRRYSCY